MPAPGPSTLGRTKHLSLVNWNEVSNNWGLPELNTSNGENATGDGETMSINGREFTRGIGVTAGSKLTYNLKRRYDTFSTYVGMDDETESAGKVKFQVWGDGRLLAESATVGDCWLSLPGRWKAFLLSA